MAYLFDEWTKALNDFSKSVTKDLAEIRKCKAEVQQMKTDIFNAVGRGYYRRDDERIILSAPEIIIGDVDKEGNLWMDGEHSKVIIRSNNISIEGVASSVGSEDGIDGGSITCRASSISNIAVDPGPSGDENVVIPDKSEIVTLGKAVKVATIDTDWVLPTHEKSAPQGVTIHSNNNLTLDASVSNKVLSAALKEQKKGIDKTKSERQKDLSKGEKDIKKSMEALKKLYDNIEKLLGESVDDVRTNAMEILDNRNQIEQLMPVLYRDMTEYINLISDLATCTQESNYLQKEMDKLSSASGDFTKKSTGASVSINAEAIAVTTKDGDSNIRENKESRVTCNARAINISSNDKNGKLIKDGILAVNAENMKFLAAEVTVDEKKKTYTVEPKGSIVMQTKNMEVSSYKYESKSQEGQPPTITRDEYIADSKLEVSMPLTKLSSLDKGGKATGKVMINATDVTIMSKNTDPKTADPTELAQNGSVSVLAEKINVGVAGDKGNTKETHITSEKLNAAVKESAEINQGEGKAIIKAAGENVDITAKAIKQKGELTVDGKSNLKDKVTGTEGEFKKLKATSALMGPKFKDPATAF